MDASTVEDFLRAIKDAVSGGRLRDNDAALPTFDPSCDLGAEAWCNNIETLSKEFGWSSIATTAKAGKALKGSALLWFETWDPSEGRSWENLKTDLCSLYPEKKNLTEKLYKAISFNSDSAESYCEYAREKLRLLRNTKIALNEIQLVELICGSITDVNVKMASFNSNIKSTSELISLFTSYVKIKKRPLEQSGRDFKEPSSKRNKFLNRANDIECYNCGKIGHTRKQCRFPTTERVVGRDNSQMGGQRPNNHNKYYCTHCKKPGHTEEYCRFKMNTKNTSADKEVNFLDKAPSN